MTAQAGVTAHASVAAHAKVLSALGETAVEGGEIGASLGTHGASTEVERDTKAFRARMRHKTVDPTYKTIDKVLPQSEGGAGLASPGRTGGQPEQCMCAFNCGNRGKSHKYQPVLQTNADVATEKKPRARQFPCCNKLVPGMMYCEQCSCVDCAPHWRDPFPIE